MPSMKIDVVILQKTSQYWNLTPYHKEIPCCTFQGYVRELVHICSPPILIFCVYSVTLNLVYHWNMVTHYSV